MKLLFFCPHFYPDNHAATGEVMTQLVAEMAKRGHTVSVVTSLPWYRDHTVADEWRGRPVRVEKTDWGRVIRVWPFPSDKEKVVGRALGFGGMTALAASAALTLGRHDVVMGMSPPIFFGDAAWITAKRWRVPFVFNVQDIFPDVAIDLGALTGSRVVSTAKRYERSLYRRSDIVTVLSEDQAHNVRGKMPGQTSKVRIIPNFVDIDRVVPLPSENSYRRHNGLEGKTVVMYSGNVGLSQSFDLIRAAAEWWQADDDVVFVINGEGAARAEVDSWVKDFPNVITVDFGSRQEVPKILAAADLHLVLLKTGLSRSSTPSKIYSILAAARPTLASIDEGSEVAKVIKQADAGLAVAPDDPLVFCRALEQLLVDKSELREMGRRARLFAETWLTPAAQAEAYDDLFRSLVSSV